MSISLILKIKKPSALQATLGMSRIMFYNMSWLKFINHYYILKITSLFYYNELILLIKPYQNEPVLNFIYLFEFSFVISLISEDFFYQNIRLIILLLFICQKRQRVVF
jgi:hypothetical protein